MKLKYTILTLVLTIVLLAGYLLLAPQPANNFNIAEEETQKTCKINIVMYTSPYCRYCVMAKELLNSHNLTLTEVDVFSDNAKAEAMVKKTGRTSVPQIFINDFHIGGYQELNDLKVTGKLNEFLKTCDISALH